MLSKAAIRAIARILLITYFFFSTVGPLQAEDFNSALDSGKSIGLGAVNSYNPLNLNSTLQSKGLGPAENLTPQSGQASQDRAQFESYYDNPSGLSPASSSSIGDFVNSSYQTRDQIDLSQDPVFGNKCLQTDAEGKCIMWSGSKDIISQSYPDCQQVQIPQYDDPQTEAHCSGTKATQTMDCTVQTPVRIETQTISMPCAPEVIEYKPGQVYAVCRDYYDYFKEYVTDATYNNDCYCGNMSGFWCTEHPPEFTLGSPPAGATLIGQSAELISCNEQSGWDDGNMRIYNWHAKYKNSVIERAYIDYNSPCGDVSRFTEPGSNCSLTRLEQCDPNGGNCLLTVENGEPTGEMASTQYLTYTTETAQAGPCSSCSCTYECIAWDGEGNCTQSEPQCSLPGFQAGCSGTCPTAAELVNAPSNSAVQTGVNNTDISPLYQQSCYVGGYNEQGEYVLTLQPGNYIPVTQNVYYADPRVCNSFSGSIENYMLCMDGTNITFQSGATAGVSLTQTQEISTSQVIEYHTSVSYIRIYGGPDVRTLANGWNMKAQFVCNTDNNDCQTLKDQGCVMYLRSCVDPSDPSCSQVEYTYHCGGTGGIIGYQMAYNCAGDIRCMGSDCVDTSYEANKDFASTAQMAELMDAIRTDGTDIEIFPGKEETCQSSPKMCCNAETGGVSIGQYVAAAKAATSIYSTLSTGISATAAANAAAATTTINSLAASTGLATVETVTVGATTVSSVTTVAGTTAVITTEATAAGASGAATVTASCASGFMAAAATCVCVVGLIIAAYVIITTVYEMGVGCTEEDMKTSVDLGFNLCHYVGEKSAGSFLGFITKKRAVYCCYGSILARLVHEQGRPQIGKSWGTGDAPRCEGFAHSEFASLDFTQMDLKEYMQYIEAKVQLSPAEMEAIQQRARQSMPNP